MFLFQTNLLVKVFMAMVPKSELFICLLFNFREKMFCIFIFICFISFSAILRQLQHFDVKALEGNQQFCSLPATKNYWKNTSIDEQNLSLVRLHHLQTQL